jgi:hypothetical protein
MGYGPMVARSDPGISNPDQRGPSRLALMASPRPVPPVFQKYHPEQRCPAC